MSIDFPSSPVLGDSYSFAGKTWTFNGSGWVGQAASSSSGGSSSPAISPFDGEDGQPGPPGPVGSEFVRTNYPNNFTAGYSATSFDNGTKTTGTFTPDPRNGNIQHYTNGGAHTLAPPTLDCSIVLEVTNSSAGAITTSGFSVVTGDAYSTAGTDKHLLFITKANSQSHLHILFVGTAAASDIAPQAGRLDYSTTTALLFKPFKGNKVKLNGAVRTIPAAGIAGLANTSVFVNGTGAQNLAANTTYLVCVFDNGGTLTGDFRTTLTHVRSTTAGNEGVEIRSGDDTRSVIGMCRTDGSSHFQDGPLTLSWFNKELRVNAAGQGNASTTDTVNQIDATSLLGFLVWENLNTWVYWAFQGATDHANGFAFFGTSIDGANGNYPYTYVYGPAPGDEAMPPVTVTLGTWISPAFGTTEGYHTHNGKFVAASGGGTVIAFNGTTGVGSFG